MKYLKTYEGIFSKLREKWLNSKVDKTDLINNIFNSLKDDGYEFTGGYDAVYSDGLYTEFTLDKLDGNPPIFREFLNGKFELYIDWDHFILLPSINNSVDGYESGYGIHDLERDFRDTIFDPYDKGVVDEIKNFIDNFEIIILNRK